MPDIPRTPSDALIADLRDARARTLTLVADLSDEQLMGPRLSIVNPMLWEIGHLAWFQERWMLRRDGSQSVRQDADTLYDSFQVAHDTRWSLPLPSRAGTLDYMQAVLERVEKRLHAAELGDEAVYFCRLATYHEDMHGEAFTYTRQTLGYPAPPVIRAASADAPASTASSSSNEPMRIIPDLPVMASAGQLTPHAPRGGSHTGDASIPGGTLRLGAPRNAPFVFDNEKWAHSVDIEPFRISRTAVTQQEFARFVTAGGYTIRDLWDEDGWRWRESAGAEAPVYWKHDSDRGWLRRHFETWVPLEPSLPVIHVNRYEAEAYSRWAGRRLPSEAEWELASASVPYGSGGSTTATGPYPWGREAPSSGRANLDARTGSCLDVEALADGDSAFGCRQMLGNVWEWTASDFAPYPGFVADPYREYSEPWFDGQYKVLRGGCWATRSRLIRTSWRNFYTADRRDVFAGFRTCAAR